MDVSHLPERTELIDIWHEELLGIANLVENLTDDQWAALSPCPGWTVGDLVAHIIDIELSLTDDPRPDHEPGWAALPHVSSDTDRFTEVGVDLRRGRSQADVVRELRDVIARRRGELDEVPEGQDIHSPMGRPVGLERMVRLRIFDSWIHEQDIRMAVDEPGGWDTDAALVTLQQLIEGLPKAWAKQAQAPAGRVLHLTVADVGRGVEAWIVSGGDGRGSVCDPVEAPDVTVILTFADFELLTAGRAPVEEVRPRVALHGDPDLGATLLRAMTLTP